ncbi:dual-specificity kinase domain protein [Trifolium pratense]|uniref:Dual-specificity kinase domain protein n=1 Tax=Trifolium pratense TaxID=57577 RepID=A0A2K3NWA4_TRIPR|nr:dual-specificity kinase domain protein [Trifolium pratense]
MSSTLLILVIGICTGFVVGAGLTFSIFVCFFMFGKKRVDVEVEKSGPMRTEVVTLHVKGSDSSSASLSDSNMAFESPRTSEWSNTSLWLEGLRKKNAACGIPKYSYKDIEKATSNFTTIIGHGAFGPVYKAIMPTGETVAVKVLGTNSRQGEQEFLTEVLLLGRLHHKNIVGLVGYVAERGRHMLLYNYMSNGSLASHLYGDNHEPLSWDSRLSIALDVARVLEYLHYGADPPIVHRDIKSFNILLDQFMKAKVTDFGLSRPEMTKPRLSNVRGTFGYLDPENPQQGLMEYVKLAAMESEGKIGWEEIVDPVLNGKYDVHKLNVMASLAFKCVNEISKIRPSMRDIVQALSQLSKKPNINSIRAPPSTLSKSPSALYEVSLEVKQSADLRRLHSR